MNIAYTVLQTQYTQGWRSLRAAQRYEEKASLLKCGVALHLVCLSVVTQVCRDPNLFFDVTFIVETETTVEL
jgi:hypothetical protein